MINTRICQLFGITYPIIQGGMIWVSGAKLAAAVSNAGGLGLIGAGSMRPDLFRKHIQKAKKLTDKPFGVNIPIFYKYAKEMVEILVEEKVKIVFFSAGSPKIYTDFLKNREITVVHVTSSVALAKKCEQANVDAVVCEGFEAGGHNGRDELTTFALVPQVADAISIPVIAAGGIADGRGMAAALALGASGVQVGSRFVCAEEASCHPAFQSQVINCEAEGTSLVLKSLIPVRLIHNAFCQTIRRMESDGADVDALKAAVGTGRARHGMFEGDSENGELEIGQVAGMIKKIDKTEVIIRQFVDEYEKTVYDLGRV